MLVMLTVHGSRLYGTNHTDSDWDWYEVHTDVKTKQRIDHDQDVTKVSMTDFVRFLDKGVPQAVEALFSPVAWWSPMYRPFFAGYRLNLFKTYDTYQRTISNFNETPKQVRHAKRLQMNLTTLLEHGRFNPTLNDNELKTLKEQYPW